MTLNGRDDSFFRMLTRFTFWLRLAVAGVFGFGLFQAVRHYQVLEFAYAEYAAFGLVFVGYFFLSQKYERTLHVIFTLAAIYVGYQAFLVEEPAKQAKRPHEIHELFSVATRLYLNEAPEPNWKRSVGFCRKGHCPRALESHGSSEFWVYVINGSKPSRWYVDDQLVLYEKIGDNLQQVSFSTSIKE